MTIEFNPNVVLLSFGVAFLGTYISVCASEQLRGIYLKNRNPKPQDTVYWLVIIGLALGGGAMWSSLYIAMASMTLRDASGNEVDVNYNIGISIMALIVSFFFNIIGISIASKDRLYAKSKVEILEFFVSTINLDEILSYTEFQILLLLATKELTYFTIGGLITGIGGVGSLFINFASIEFPGHIEWNGGIVFVSVLLALSSGVSAFWIFFRLLSIYPDSELLRFVIAFSGSMQISAIDYITLIAADFKINKTKSVEVSWDTGIMTRDDAIYAVTLASMILLWLVAILVFSDLRMKVNLYRAHLQKLAPQEKLSDLLNTAENSLDPKDSTTNSNKHVTKSHGARNAVAPLAFNDDDYPL